MNKFWNWVRNEDTGAAELIFNGPISEDTWFGDEITPAMFRNELAKISGDLTVWLNSPGGDVFAASQIYTMLRSHKDKVTVKRAFGDGFVLIHDEGTIFRNIRNHILHRTKHTVHIDILSATGGNKMNSGFDEPADKF